MKKIILIIAIMGILQSCRVCCNGSPKHYNARNLSDRVDAPCINVPDIVLITDIVGKPVDNLNDGVYIVTLSDNTRVKVIN